MEKKMGKRNIRILILKGVRLLFIPLSMIMYYFTVRAWGDIPGLILSIAFGGSFFLIINSSIMDVIGSDLKKTVEQIVERVTESPVHIEFGKMMGRMSFFIFLQEDSEAVTKVIYKKIVERLKMTDYFSRIEIISMANVPNLEKETIEKFKKMMMKNAIEMARKEK